VVTFIEGLLLIVGATVTGVVTFIEGLLLIVGATVAEGLVFMFGAVVGATVTEGLAFMFGGFGLFVSDRCVVTVQTAMATAEMPPPRNASIFRFLSEASPGEMLPWDTPPSCKPFCIIAT
jgi:hypothetical protein